MKRIKSPATNAEYSNGRKPVSEIGGEGSNPSSATRNLEGLLVFFKDL